MALTQSQLDLGCQLFAASGEKYGADPKYPNAATALSAANDSKEFDAALDAMALSGLMESNEWQYLNGCFVIGYNTALANRTKTNQQTSTNSTTTVGVVAGLVGLGLGMIFGYVIGANKKRDYE